MLQATKHEDVFSWLRNNQTAAARRWALWRSPLLSGTSHCSQPHLPRLLTMKSITLFRRSFVSHEQNMHHHLIYLANAQHITISHFSLRSMLTSIQFDSKTCDMRPPATFPQGLFNSGLKDLDYQHTTAAIAYLQHH